MKEYQPRLQQQVYDDMAWGGLIGTSIFDDLSAARAEWRSMPGVMENALVKAEESYVVL